MATTTVTAAAEDVHLGASISDVYERFLMSKLEVEKEDELSRALGGLPMDKRREVREEAVRFTGDLCRLLGERFRGEHRIARVLEEWAARSKDYDAFDSLLCNFDFPARERMLAEGKRLFPSSLTSHW